MTDLFLIGDLGIMMESPQIEPVYLKYLFYISMHRSRPRPPWGVGPAPSEVQECWEQLNSWKSRDDFTTADLANMLRNSRAPECRLEQVEGLRGVIGGYISRRVRAACQPKSRREPPERIAAACAELRRAIPDELEWLKFEIRDLSADERPTHEREISRLTQLLESASIEDRFPRLDDEVDPVKYDPQAVMLIFLSYEMIFGQSAISRSSPAVQFIGNAIRRIGWHSISSGAIEQLLRRSLSQRAPISRKFTVRPL